MKGERGRSPTTTPSESSFSREPAAISLDRARRGDCRPMRRRKRKPGCAEPSAFERAHRVRRSSVRALRAGKCSPRATGGTPTSPAPRVDSRLGVLHRLDWPGPWASSGLRSISIRHTVRDRLEHPAPCCRSFRGLSRGERRGSAKPRPRLPHSHRGPDAGGDSSKAARIATCSSSIATVAPLRAWATRWNPTPRMGSRLGSRLRPQSERPPPDGWTSADAAGLAIFPGLFAGKTRRRRSDIAMRSG